MSQKKFCGKNEHVIREHWFDMDHTLIDNDCDVSWKEFLVAKKLAPANALELAAHFYEQYKAGTLDAEEFTRFQLAEFTDRPVAEMTALAQEHFDRRVKPKVYGNAFDLVQELKENGLRVAILTSTNTVVARPTARFFGVDALYGTELEIVDGLFTGRYAGAYAVGAGKVEIAGADTAKRGIPLHALAYYGDSINDRFILEAVGTPYAANPDAALRALAVSRGWQILNFKDGEGAQDE